MSSIVQTLTFKSLATTAFYIASSSFGRKTLFISAMYAAGSMIVSIVGLLPVATVGALVWLF